MTIDIATIRQIIREQGERVPAPREEGAYLGMRTSNLLCALADVIDAPRRAAGLDYDANTDAIDDARDLVFRQRQDGRLEVVGDHIVLPASFESY